MPVADLSTLVSERAHAIRAYHERVRVPKAEIDVSGGVDSAVVLGLLARALGPGNVVAAWIGISSSPESLANARLAAGAFGVRLIETDLTPLFGDLVALMRRRMEAAGYDPADVQARVDDDPTVLGSIRSTLRAPVGRGFNRLAGGGIRHGTGNECEDRWLRFYQKGGDGEVDANPIAMLSKGEVYQLAVALGVPRPIVEAVPTPDLWGAGRAHSDEDELRAITGTDLTYSRVDYITARYVSVGTIERVSRFADAVAANPGSRPGGLFADDLRPEELQALLRQAESSELLEGLDARRLVTVARAMERATRHKWNPNCPALGDRRALVRAGILTDRLPRLAHKTA